MIEAVILFESTASQTVAIQDEISKFSVVVTLNELDNILAFPHLDGHDIAVDLVEDLLPESLGALVLEQRLDIGL